MFAHKVTLHKEDKLEYLALKMRRQLLTMNKFNRGFLRMEMIGICRIILEAKSG